MKKKHTIVAFIAVISICGCEKARNDITPTNNQQEEETVTVSLGLGGEITISETPLSCFPHFFVTSPRIGLRAP